MKQYVVYGKRTLLYSKIVEAKNKKDAIAIADDELERGSWDETDMSLISDGTCIEITGADEA